MPSLLVDDILSNAQRAGVPLTQERAEQIAKAVTPRLDAFALARRKIAFDDAPTFESALLAARSTEGVAP